MSGDPPAYGHTQVNTKIITYIKARRLYGKNIKFMNKKFAVKLSFEIYGSEI